MLIQGAKKFEYGMKIHDNSMATTAPLVAWKMDILIPKVEFSIDQFFLVNGS